MPPDPQSGVHDFGRRHGGAPIETVLPAFRLGAVTVAAAVVAGLLDPVAIAVYAIVLSLPVWAA